MSLGYAGLTPIAVLDALASAGLHGDGRILQLNSYENRVFQVYLEDGRIVVAKFYRPGRWSDEQIIEEHAFALELAAADIPVVPPLRLDGHTLLHLPGQGTLHRMSVSPCVSGRAPELEHEGTLQWLGRFLGRMHAQGAAARFKHRRHMQPLADAHAARRLLLDGGFVTPNEAPAWEALSEQAAQRIGAAFAAVENLRQLRLHGDCHLGNVLWRPEGPHVVDLDDACTGPAVQDLWMLVSGDARTMATQLAAVLAGYRQFMPFDVRELALIEPLRTLRMLRHSAWLAERVDDPAVAQAFSWFGSAAYWSQQITQLREQLEAMNEPPLLSGGSEAWMDD